MQIDLYFSPGACSFVPHVGLEMVQAATGQGFTPHLVKLHKGEHRTPEFLAMNPEGQVPTLQIDGATLTQILAMADWLDHRFPQAGLLPSDPWARAQALSQLAWMNNTAHPTFTHFFMPGKFTPDEAAQAAIKTHAVEAFRRCLERVQGWTAQAGGGWLAGKGLSIVDAYVLTLTRWGSMAGIDPESLPTLWAYVQRVAATAPAAAAIERERLTLNTLKKA